MHSTGGSDCIFFRLVPGHHGSKIFVMQIKYSIKGPSGLSQVVFECVTLTSSIVSGGRLASLPPLTMLQVSAKDKDGKLNMRTAN